MQKNISEVIIERLLPGQLHVPTLALDIAKENKVSIQAVYKALRILKKEEKITIYSKYVALSLIWLDKEKEKIRFAEYAYTKGKDIVTHLQKDKSKVSFKFKTIAEQDLFWTHTYTILTNTTEKESPRYLLIPHDFFSYSRKESDDYWIEKNFKKEIDTRLVISHTKPIDTLVINERRRHLKGRAQFLLHKNPLQQENNIYYNILGDYIFKAKFDLAINKTLEMYLGSLKKLPTKEEERVIRNIIHTKGTFIFSIEKNKKKVIGMTKKLRKYFE